MITDEELAYVYWFEQNKDYLGPVTESQIKKYEEIISKIPQSEVSSPD